MHILHVRTLNLILLAQGISSAWCLGEYQPQWFTVFHSSSALRARNKSLCHKERK